MMILVMQHTGHCGKVTLNVKKITIVVSEMLTYRPFSTKAIMRMKIIQKTEKSLHTYVP